MVAELKIDVGAGAKREAGYLTVDVTPYFKPDFLASVTDLPFDDESVGEVRCWHVLEHLPREQLITAMNEMWRVLKVDGVLDIEVPVFPHWPAMADPTHISFYVPQTFDYFIRCDKPHEHGGEGCFENHRLMYGIKPWSDRGRARLHDAQIARVALGKLQG